MSTYVLIFEHLNPKGNEMNRKLVSTLLCIFLFGTLSANAQTFNCINTDLGNYGPAGFIPETSQISRTDGKYFYTDALVRNLGLSKGILGKSKSISNDRIYFDYDFQMPLQNSSDAKITYKVIFFTKKRRVSYSAILSGYDNNIRGNGWCR